MGGEINKVKMQYPWKYMWHINSPYNWMINDLFRGIQTNSNYLVALGIFAYSEAIGWKLRGEDDKDSKGWLCYENFTKKYMGNSYDFMTYEIRNSARNGLAHRYFVKNLPGRVSRDSGDLPCGIASTSEITIYIGLTQKQV